MAVQRVRSERLPIQKVAQAMGAVFLLVGIAGFIPGITSDYDKLSWAGHESAAMLLGIFAVSVLHNLVHLAYGVAGFLMSRTPHGARNFLIGGGAVYAVLWLYGLVINKNSTANFVPLNTGDDWLHFVLGFSMIALGLLLSRGPATRRTNIPHQAR